MNDLELVHKTNLEYPYNVNLHITDSCFFKCKMCASWKTKNTHYLKTEMYNKFFEDLLKIKGPDTTIQFAGGEPLLHPHIYEILSSANRYGYVTQLHTNGWLVKNNIPRIFEAGLNYLWLSFDSSNSELHDEIRGVPGSYHRVLDGAKTIKKYFKARGKDIKINITCTISALNLKDILNVVEFVEKFEHIDQLQFQAITAPFSDDQIKNNKVYKKLDKEGQFVYDSNTYWYEHKEYSYLWPNNKKMLLNTYSKLIQKLRKNKNIFINEECFNKQRLIIQFTYFLHPDKRMKNLECTAYKDLLINPDGDVYNCSEIMKPLGNIKINPIDKIWKSQKTQKAKERILKCNINCHHLINCGYLKI